MEDVEIQLASVFSNVSLPWKGPNTVSLIDHDILAFHFNCFSIWSAVGSVFSSGMAATAAIFGLLESGNSIVCSDDVYGGNDQM